MKSVQQHEHHRIRSGLPPSRFCKNNGHHASVRGPSFFRGQAAPHQVDANAVVTGVACGRTHVRDVSTTTTDLLSMVRMLFSALWVLPFSRTRWCGTAAHALLRTASACHASCGRLLYALVFGRFDRVVSMLAWAR